MHAHKVSKLQEYYNATVEIHGHNVLEAKSYAMKLAEERGLRYVNG